MSFNQSHAFLSIPSGNLENSTTIQLFHPSSGQAGVMADLNTLSSIPSIQCNKDEFMGEAGKLSYSFTHSEGNSPNKKILAVFVHPKGYETFGYPKEEGWKHYLFQDQTN